MGVRSDYIYFMPLITLPVLKDWFIVYTGAFVRMLIGHTVTPGQ